MKQRISEFLIITKLLSLRCVFISFSSFPPSSNLDDDDELNWQPE
jgi:hypothetical protein